MVTALMVVLALFNGLLIVTNRAFNARLGRYVSGAGASFWNHVVGCLFLALIVPFLTGRGAVDMGEIPFYLFLGGIIGAGYVAVNSFVMPRVGATKATVLVIAGQIIFGTMIDVTTGKIDNLMGTLIGIALVVLGMWIGNHKQVADTKPHEPHQDFLKVSAAQHGICR